MSRELKKYCSECGNPVVYSLENKPKFCSECGSAMFGANASKSPEKTLEKPKRVVDGEMQNIDDEDMTHDLQEWNGTSILSLDIEANISKPTSFKLGDVMPPPEENNN